MQTKDNISATQQKLQYNPDFAMQDNAAQQWWYSTILARNTISNTGTFPKMYIQIFWRDGVMNPTQSDS